MKKNKSSLAGIGACCAALLGIAALLMPFAPFVTGTLSTILGSASTNINGFDLIFGDYSNAGSVTAWILILVGAVLALCATITYFLGKGKIATLGLLAGGALILVGAILYFFFIQFAGLSGASAGELASYSWSLAIGAWLGAIFGIIGGVIGLCVGIREFLKK